jgi:hypothetical protein
MRLLKGFIITVAGLFVVITLLSLLMPSTVMTARSVTVQAPQQKIYEQVADLNNWKNWHPVFKGGPAGMVISTPAAGKGAYAEWETNNKKNRLEITGVSANAVWLTLKRPGKNDVVNQISFTPFEADNSIQVEWMALTKLKWYPWEKFSGILIDKITGPGYDTALKELKAYTERR